VHARQHLRLFAREALEDGGGLRRVRVVVHRRAERLTRAQNVGLGDRRGAAAALREEVAAEQRARGRLHHEAAVPAVRHVRGIEPAQHVRAGGQDLAVGERPCGADGEIVHRDHRAHLAADRDGVRGDGEEVVERAALVGLEVREGDVADRVHRQRLADRLGDQREHAARAGVEDERLGAGDQVLVEVEG